MRVLAVAVKSSGNDVYFAATAIVDLRRNAEVGNARTAYECSRKL